MDIKYFILILILLIISSLSIIFPVFFTQQIRELKEINNEHKILELNYFNTLREKLDSFEIQLQDLGVLFYNNNNTNYEIFQIFSNNTLKTTNDIQGFSYALKVLNSERKNIENIASNIYNIPLEFRDIVNGSLITSLNHSFYFIVYYITPVETNENAILFNLYSQSQRAISIDNAILSGKSTISDGIRLVQETKEQVGILMFYPVYDDYFVLPEERNSSIVGLTTIVLKMENAMKSTFGKLEKIEGMEIVLYNPRANETLSSLIVKQGEFTKKDLIDNHVYTSFDLKFGDNIWQLKIYIPANINFLQSYIILIVGLLLLAFVLTIGCILYYYFNKSMEIQIIKKEADVKNVFIGYIFHEIRVPFNTINLGIKYLLSEELGDDNHNTVVRMNKNIQQCSRILNDVLDISKIEKGKFEISLNYWNISKNFFDCIELFTQEVINKNIKYDYYFDSELKGLEIEIDELRIVQCMSNYISNAIKFTEIGGDIFIKLEILQKYINNNGNYLELEFSVKDNGCGIDISEQNKIFKPYVQIVNNKSEIGTGLGLSITKHIIESHRGSVSFTSEKDNGSIFIFKIHCKYKKKQEEEKFEVSDFSLEGEKFLIVDDNEDNCIFMQKMLLKMKIESDIAFNGIEGLEKFKNGKYSLVILDKNMPLMDGKECAINLRKFTDVPIVMLSGHHDIVNNMKGIDINGILTKPIYFPSFVKILKDIFK